MDQLEIKEEPVWLEGAASTSLNATDIKDEIIIEEHTVEELVPHFKEESSAGSLEAIYYLSTSELLPLQCEMDQSVEIKEEPVWLEGIPSTSTENFEPVSEMIPLKQEITSELTERGPSQQNTFKENFEHESSVICLEEETKSELSEVGPTQNATDIKDEIIIEGGTVDELVPHIKKDSVENVPVLTMQTGDGMQRCTVCSMIFSQELNQKGSHSEGSSVCNTCKRTSRKKNTLKEHEIFLSIKLFLCKECDKAFVRQDLLRSHMETHTGETTYQGGDLCADFHVNTAEYCCKECGRLFVDWSSLRKHIMTHTEGRPYRCETCNSNFTQERHLRAHMVCHSGERRFRCTQCSSTFARQNSLKSHMVVHTAERPYRCEVCSKTFTHRNSRNVHMVIHTGLRPYQCQVCDKSYTQRNHLRTHMAVHSRE